MFWNDALTTRDARKVVKMLGLTAACMVLGLVASLEKVLFLACVLAFTLPKAYDAQHVAIDELAQVLQERFERRLLPLYDKVSPALHAVLVRLEPILGTFDP
jgi:hypothetical protein